MYDYRMCRIVRSAKRISKERYSLSFDATFSNQALKKLGCKLWDPTLFKKGWDATFSKGCPCTITGCVGLLEVLKEYLKRDIP
jgi:hypothetical protein